MFLLTASLALAAAPPAGAIARFRTQEIETTLKVGYAVTAADVNADGRPDLVVIDAGRVLWYENPSWTRHTVLKGGTPADNVCAAPLDVDGDGKLDLVLGADWKPFNTRTGGTLHWLRQGKDPAGPWDLFPIASEPTVHRVRAADLDGDGRPEVVLAPLMGRDSTKEKNWSDGRPVRLLGFRVPADPVKGPWVPEVLDESLHVVHNVWPVPAASGRGHDLLTASYEGAGLLGRDAGRWRWRKLGEGNQATPAGSRGASEIKMGRLKGGARFVATIEPWHGHEVVVYTEPAGGGPWARHVLDDQLKWGHAVWCADLDGDGGDELVIGVRDVLAREPGRDCGVRAYRATDAAGAAWERQVVEGGGVAVEDAIAHDLDGDGRPEIVAVGRKTGNARIYWNLGR